MKMTDVGKFRRLLAVFEYDAEDLSAFFDLWLDKAVSSCYQMQNAALQMRSDLNRLLLYRKLIKNINNIIFLGGF